MVTLLNTSILTSYGTYQYEPLTLEQAQQLVATGFVSAIGHENAAAMLSDLLSVRVPVKRVNYVQEPGTAAVVFKLKSRVPAGVILARQDIEQIGYACGLLRRVA